MSDYSKEYTDDKKSNIFFGRSHKIVHFKPFLKSFNYRIKFKDEDASNVYTPVPMTDTFEEAEYKFTIDVVASSAQEAKENHSKFQKLLRIVMPVGEAQLNPPFIYVKFSNLIHNNSPTSFRSLTYKKLEEIGQSGVVEKLDYKPDMDMGFFEYDGLIFAKAFTMDISLFISSAEDAGRTETPISEDYIIHGKKSGFSYGRSKIEFDIEE